MEKLQQQPQQLPTIDDDKKENKISSSQHRHYLSYEGFGIGTMSQREKQYNQYRMMKATEKVQEYQVKKFTYMQEDAIVLKEKKFTRKLKISSAIDRVVEDLIQEAISKGEFHNLSGSGKSLSFSNHNPMLDITTHNLNKILINNGYTPEWIVMRKDIIENLRNFHSNLAMSFIHTKGSLQKCFSIIFSSNYYNSFSSLPIFILPLHSIPSDPRGIPIILSSNSHTFTPFLFYSSKSATRILSSNSHIPPTSLLQHQMDFPKNPLFQFSYLFPIPLLQFQKGFLITLSSNSHTSTCFIFLPLFQLQHSFLIVLSSNPLLHSLPLLPPPSCLSFSSHCMPHIVTLISFFHQILYI
ncbi:DNAJC28 [Acanthosepion pharaonis]|uniref:DNAJC28 n=1 Tax=Acanthosepion pharaonis TaxID=158019 RepID=A0A812B8M8_ACAPH|nr:DNAJC28 [Sepia pharaonis]